MTTPPPPMPPQMGTPSGYQYQPTPPQPKGLGIAAMVVGIVSLVLAFIPVIGYVSFLLGLVSIGLGIAAVVKVQGKGQGIAGIVTGAVSLVVALVVAIIIGLFVTAIDQTIQEIEEEFSLEPEEIELEPTTDSSGEAAVPADKPQAYSALTIIGDESALPVGADGEVSVVAISEPERNTSFPFILHNQTDGAISRAEVSGRALDTDGNTLGTGSSHFVYPNVILPGGYGFGYVYIDSSERDLPAGAAIAEPRVEYTEGLGRFENVIALDIENYEELPSGDLTGDVSNPHEVTVDGPVSIDTVCLSADEQVTYYNTFSDNDSVEPGSSSTWTLSSYRDVPECAVRLISASGYDF